MHEQPWGWPPAMSPDGSLQVLSVDTMGPVEQVRDSEYIRLSFEPTSQWEPLCHFVPAVYPPTSQLILPTDRCLHYQPEFHIDGTQNALGLSEHPQPQPGPAAKHAREESDSDHDATVTRGSSTQFESTDCGYPSSQLQAELQRPLRKRTKKQTQRGRAAAASACHRCRNQKIKCVQDTERHGEFNGPCEPCRKLFRRNSKKIEHWFPCLFFRIKLNALVIYRAGNLGLTQRFDHTKMVNLPAVDPQKVFTIHITQGLCAAPMELEVHYFLPAMHDRLDREFVVDGVRRVQRLPPVCLRDVKKTSKVFVDYVRVNAFEAIREVVKHEKTDDIIRDTFAAVLKHFNTLEYGSKERELLKNTVRHWFAIKHGFGSASICGEETLDIPPISGYAPMNGLLSIPRMVIAQFDSIRHLTMHANLQGDVLGPFETLLLGQANGQWFTVFLVTFLFLQLVSDASSDRLRYVRENSRGQALETRYGKLGDPNTKFVEDLHYSAAVLLAHWDYYKRCDLVNVEGKGIDKLEPYQLDLIKSIASRLKQKADSIPNTPLNGCWEHGLAWMSRMFAPKTAKGAIWSPPPLFTQEKPSLGL